MSHHLVFLHGSPSPDSRSSFVAETLAARLQRSGIASRRWSLADFDAADVLTGRGESAAVVELTAALRNASGLVLATPVYKATYAGGLKAIVDLIAPDALLGKLGLGIATARAPAHVASTSRAFAELFEFFRASALPTLAALDDEIVAAPTGRELASSVRERIEHTAARIIAHVNDA